MKTITQHEKDKHSETPVTWEQLGFGLFSTWIVLATIYGTIVFIMWIFGAFQFSPQPEPYYKIHCNEGFRVTLTSTSLTRVLMCDNGESYLNKPV